jgi:hypothetical protein
MAITGPCIELLLTTHATKHNEHSQSIVAPIEGLGKSCLFLTVNVCDNKLVVTRTVSLHITPQGVIHTTDTAEGKGHITTCV